MTIRSLLVSCLALAACSEGSKPISLTRLTEVASSSKCPAGGVAISTGLDKNNNQTLEESEVTQTSEVCNGKTPSDGDAGTPGLTSLVETTSLPVGDANCLFGGVRIDYGFDDGAGGGVASNKKLEAGEVLGSRYVCNGGSRYFPGSTAPPLAPAGQFKIISSGGNGTAGSGGVGGDLTIKIPNGTLGGHTKVFSAGLEDASFVLGAAPVFNAGSTPMKNTARQPKAGSTNPTTTAASP